MNDTDAQKEEAEETELELEDLTPEGDVTGGASNPLLDAQKKEGEGV